MRPMVSIREWLGMQQWKERLRLIGVILGVLVVLILVLQNTENVETKLLLWSFTMPRAAFVFGALAMGFLAGAVFGPRMMRRK